MICTCIREEYFGFKRSDVAAAAAVVRGPTVTAYWLLPETIMDIHHPDY